MGIREPPENHGWLRRVVRDGLGRFGARSDVPGSETWFAELDRDIAQSVRNAGDYADVIVRRERRLAQATDPSARFAERVALTGVAFANRSFDAAREQLQAAFDVGVVPDAFVERCTSLLGWFARWGVAHDELVDWYARLLEVATEQRLPLLDKLARLHGHRYDFHSAAKVGREALHELGWLDAAGDPFRRHPRRIDTYDDDARALLLSLVTNLVRARAWVGDVDGSRELLAAIRETLGGAVRHDELETLSYCEAAVDFKEGRYEEAKEAYRDLLHNLEGLGLGDKEEALPAVASLALAFLELGLVNKGRRRSQARAQAGEQGPVVRPVRARPGVLRASRGRPPQGASRSGPAHGRSRPRILARCPPPVGRAARVGRADLRRG